MQVILDIHSIYLIGRYRW